MTGRAKPHSTAIGPAAAALEHPEALTAGAPVISQYIYNITGNTNSGRDLIINPPAGDLCKIIEAQSATISRLLGIIEAQARQLEALTAATSTE